jgi:hypothetical protein
MDFEKMEGIKDLMDTVIDALADSGSSKFRMLKSRKALFNKINDLISSDDVVNGREELAEKIVAVFEQFENIINDFIEENNITIENK